MGWMLMDPQRSHLCRKVGPSCTSATRAPLRSGLGAFLQEPGGICVVPPTYGAPRRRAVPLWPRGLDRPLALTRLAGCHQHPQKDGSTEADVADVAIHHGSSVWS